MRIFNNGTISTISVRSWWSVLLWKDIGVPLENHQPATTNRQTLFYEPAVMCSPYYWWKYNSQNVSANSISRWTWISSDISYDLFLCWMVCVEKRLFISLILMELLTITVSIFFSINPIYHTTTNKTKQPR